MKIVNFKAYFLSDVIQQFVDWKDENEVVIHAVTQMFDPDGQSEIIVWYRR